MNRLFISAAAAASVIAPLALAVDDAVAKGKGGGARPSYSGSKESSAHGGGYSGDTGSP
jgi:hypothetical protein